MVESDGNNLRLKMIFCIANNVMKLLKGAQDVVSDLLQATHIYQMLHREAEKYFLIQLCISCICKKHEYDGTVANSHKFLEAKCLCSHCNEFASVFLSSVIAIILTSTPPSWKETINKIRIDTVIKTQRMAEKNVISSMSGQMFNDVYSKSTGYFDDTLRYWNGVYSPAKSSTVQCYPVLWNPVNKVPEYILNALEPLKGEKYQTALVGLPRHMQHALMNDEEHRTRTFGFNWSHELKHPSANLAKQGFFLKDSRLIRSCIFCRLTASTFTSAFDDRHNKFCSDRYVFYRGVEYELTNAQLLSSMKIKVKGGDKVLTFTDLGIVMHNPQQRFMSKDQKRKTLYKKWCFSMPIHPDKLSAAGFCYKSKLDAVQCFFCGIVLEHWKGNDDPWLHHAKCSPGCGFVLLMRGMEIGKQAENLSQNFTVQMEAEDCLTICTKGTEPPRRIPAWKEIYQPYLDKGYSQSTIDRLLQEHSQDFRMAPTAATKYHTIIAVLDQLSQQDESSTSVRESDVLTADQMVICASCGDDNEPSHICLPCGCFCLCAECVTLGVPETCPACTMTVAAVLEVFRL